MLASGNVMVVVINCDSPVTVFQIRTVLSYDPETTRLQSWENATDITQSLWPFSSASTSPVIAFQIRTVLSSDPETTRLPSWENATDVTESVWPFSSASTSPVVVFQIRTVLSSDPETTRLPSWENATEFNLEPFCIISSVGPHELDSPSMSLGTWRMSVA